ncbi:MAG: F0F1 ATP synthase subunit gamma [Rhodobacteraceae bacterium]|nr:F0F1 ATP synthase subunit gamma [Paracoccaceae bacterium]
MTERPEDIQRRLHGLDDIGQVVGALRAIASGHAATSRDALDAIAAHARTVEAALDRLAFGALAPDDGPGLLLVVGAAQGFSGAYPMHLAEAARGALTPGTGILVVGERTLSMMGMPGETMAWSADLPAHPAEVPALASDITDQLIGLSARFPGPIRLVGGRDLPGQPVGTRRLWPPEAAPREVQAHRDPPLMTLPADVLLAAVLQEALFAAVALALMEGLRAENQARVEAMTRAQGNLRRKRLEVEQDYKRARQEQMTSEMLELTLGSDAG